MLTKEEFVNREIDNMKKDLAELVSYPSVYSEDEAPFGSVNRKCLDAALAMMNRKGLSTVNLDYYCGYGETGQGDEIIGIVGHLDVVPAPDEGWATQPFEMVEKDGILYGRGVSDDKGGVVASLYAIQYLLETGYSFRKRVRLITGCDEESGSFCMKHYVEKEGQNIACGYTPDAEFPGIFAEKGMCGGDVECCGSKFISIHGGEADNIVAKHVEAIVPLDSFDEDVFVSFMNEHHIEFEMNKEEDSIQLIVHGASAHGSLPDKGVNAIAHLMEALYAAEFDDELTNFWHRFIALKNHGELLGCEALTDRFTDLSFNVGVIDGENGNVRFSVDCRFPVTRTLKEALPYLEKMKSEHTRYIPGRLCEPLFFDIDSPMIQKLTEAYASVTGDNVSKMEAIGGGTYAKSIKGIVAFGCCFANEDGNIHSPNEYLPIESFKKQVLCYIEAIKNLNELEYAHE